MAGTTFVKLSPAVSGGQFSFLSISCVLFGQSAIYGRVALAINIFLKIVGIIVFVGD